jgi:predicted AlkP superfamily pyrophosphatase or phosphodiesterase
MLTGKMPNEHGIVGNGWYDRNYSEVRFWQQSNHLISGELLYQGIDTAKMFWWFNQHSHVNYSATPKPHYGCDGSKVFDIIDDTGCQLVKHLGPFPFFSFWGPNAGLPASDWIARATAKVLREKKPQLTLCYLPHLDYDFQRFSKPNLERVAEVDRCASMVINAAQDIGAIPIIVSEYGLVPVSRPVSINRILRRAGMLTVRQGPFGEMLIPGDCRAFAVADHQVAHVYVNDPGALHEVRELLIKQPGIQSVVHPEELQLEHTRSGDWIALAQNDSWFTYYYWNDDKLAPDFARTVDIHRKPGYDPCELFITSKYRAMFRLAQKKLGLRMKMDVIPLDPSLVGGSHGLVNAIDQNPILIGPDAPEDILQFKDYIRGLLQVP